MYLSGLIPRNPQRQSWVISATCVFTWFSREIYQPFSGLALMGLQSQIPHRVVPNISPFFCLLWWHNQQPWCCCNQQGYGSQSRLQRTKGTFFLRPDLSPRSCSFQYKATAASGIVFRLSQAGVAKQPRDQETFYRQNEDSGCDKTEG